MSLTFAVRAPKRVAKDLAALPKDVRQRVVQRFERLADTPIPHDAVRVEKYRPDHVWRVRVGDYRIVYRVLEAEAVVEVVLLEHRKDVYR